MLKGLYTAYTGMLNEQNRMDVLTNNLANSATIGFKKEGSTSQGFDSVLAYRIKDMQGAGTWSDVNIGIGTPGVKIGENYVDYHDCYDWLVSLVEQYEILPLVVGYDRYSAQYLVQDLEAYGFQTDDVYQGDNLWQVLQEMEGLIKDGRVHIGDNDLLKVHLLNSAIKMNNERGRGRLIKIHKDAHIDLTAALADAFCVRQKWFDEIGNRLRNEG